MLNLVSFDISDSHILEDSYNAFKNKEEVEIVSDTQEKEQIFRQTIENVRRPNNANFSFQNLFKLKNLSGHFYIAQCIADFGYPIGTKGSQTFQQKYSFQLVGIANLQIDLGITHLRPEKKLDKILTRFFYNDIDFDGVEKFNEKYFLVSNRRTEVLKYFDKKFLNTIAKYNDILLTTNGRQMFISFDQELNSNQTRIAQDIFTNFRYIENK
ncbi:hypothetical protein BH11BAC5_BH11BAC5_00230 [soil metagenome]